MSFRCLRAPWLLPYSLRDPQHAGASSIVFTFVSFFAHPPFVPAHDGAFVHRQLVLVQLPIPRQRCRPAVCAPRGHSRTRRATRCYRNMRAPRPSASSRSPHSVRGTPTFGLSSFVGMISCPASPLVRAHDGAFVHRQLHERGAAPSTPEMPFRCLCAPLAALVSIVRPAVTVTRAPRHYPADLTWSPLRSTFAIGATRTFGKASASAAPLARRISYLRPRLSFARTSVLSSAGSALSRDRPALASDAVPPIARIVAALRLVVIGC
ncbi:hypothetical protein B0H11DRAFT_2223706 [Mycena galericulata]|nr:hypothetical protein B0H11DRAFT_2223706 [Mycena galericulata]